MSAQHIDHAKVAAHEFVAIALGSNMGDRMELLRRALRAIIDQGVGFETGFKGALEMPPSPEDLLMTLSRLLHWAGSWSSLPLPFPLPLSPVPRL